MKKNCVFLVLLLFSIFVIPNVHAADASFFLTCDKKEITKGESTNCSLKVKVTEGVLKSVKANVSVNTSLFEDVSSIDEDNLNISSDGTVKSFSLKAKDVTGTGDVSVSVSETVASDDTLINIIKQPASETITILDNDTTINSIKIDGVEASCDKSKTECSVDVNKKDAKIEILAQNAKSVSGNGDKSLNCGQNIFNFTITAYSGDTRGYSIKVNRSCDTISTLKGIAVSNGSLSPSFDSNTKNYVVNVNSNVEKITIAGTKANPYQTVSGEVKDRALKYGNNEFTLTVTSESGAVTTYKIVVNRKDDRNDDTTLKSITLSDGAIKFDKNKAEYTIKVLFDVKKVKVSAKALNDKATVTYENNEQDLKVGKDNKILIKVTSEKGTEKIYTINIERLEEGETLGDNPNLSNIVISGYDLDFKSKITEYTIKGVEEDTLDIEAIPEDKNSIVKISGNKNLKNNSVITIKVTSPDGTEKEYKIVVLKSNKKLLLSILIGIASLTIIFVIVLLIKNKKNKSFNKPKVKPINNKKLKGDEALLAKVQAQLGETTKEEIKKPILEESQSLPKKDDILILDETLPTRKTQIGEQRIVEDKAKIDERIIENRIFEERKPLEEEKASQAPNSSLTKVCSICGHRVSVNLETCPYCKRKF